MGEGVSFWFVIVLCPIGGVLCSVVPDGVKAEHLAIAFQELLEFVVALIGPERNFASLGRLNQSRDLQNAEKRKREGEIVVSRVSR